MSYLFQYPYKKIIADSYQILSTDFTLSVDNGGVDYTIFLPMADTCKGKIYIIKRYDSNSTGRVDISDTNVEANIQDPNTGIFEGNFSLEAIGTIHATAIYQSNGTQWEYIS